MAEETRKEAAKEEERKKKRYEKSMAERKHNVQRERRGGERAHARGKQLAPHAL